MKQYKGYEQAKAYTDFEKLPAGAYIVQIQKTPRVELTRSGGEILIIPFDICEGEYEGYFMKQFNESTMADKKYKGVFRVFLPTEDGSEQDEWALRRLKTIITAIEDSNPGYHWDWKEAGLVGKQIGMLFQNKEWDWNGKTGWSAQPHSLKSVDDIRAGNYKLPQDKPLENKRPSLDINPTGDPALSGFETLASDDGDLPF